MNIESKKRFAYAALFAIAMGYLEAAVVIYLRLHYYPEGFAFPLRMLPDWVALIEIGRELATILMLLGLALLIPVRPLCRFAYFIYCFALWDIFYYLFLKLILGWPASIMTSDVLFLIPVVWTGPVLAPLIVSLTMITAACIIIYREDQDKPLCPNRADWTLAVLGGLVIILSFCQDYRSIMAGGSPLRFRWELFLTGEALGIAAFVRIILRRYRSLPQPRTRK